MRIGIVTFYKTPNYGAMLQAYSLWRYLSQLGHEVYFVRHPYGVLYNIPFWRCFVSRTFRGYWHKVGRRVLDYIGYSVTAFANSFPICDMVSDFDVAIVGSDQMWNPRWVVPDAINTVFLDFVSTKCRRISYAVSFSVPEWGYKMRGEVGKLLNKFYAISVRELSGCGIVKELSGRDAEMVVDPTMLWTGDFFREITPNAEEMCPYVFRYLINGWSDNNAERKIFDNCIKAIGHKKILSDKNSFGISIKVEQWLARIANSSYVFTNSFHGMVFAILFHRLFNVVLLDGVNSGMNERIKSLADALGLGNRVCTSGGYPDAVGEPIDWIKVDCKLDNLRDKSIAFLRKNLQKRVDL